MGLKTVWQHCQELTKEQRSFVLVTMTDFRGSAPQDPGAKAIITQEGLFFGTVGGGKIEAHCIKTAQSYLEKRETKPISHTWNLQTEIGMTCGGEVSFLFETFISQSWPIVIFGAGHVSQALTRTLANLNCQVTCIDHRQEWIDKLEIENAICHPSPKDLVKDFASNSFFISMTQGHAHDVPILKEIALSHPQAPFVGVIGSKIKGQTIKKELIDMNIDESFIEKLIVPIGLDIGTNHPYEIAISIVAQLLEYRDR